MLSLLTLGFAAFVPVARHAVNLTRDGRVVAVLPLDDLAWTDLPRRTFGAANAELRRSSPGRGAVFATTGYEQSVQNLSQTSLTSDMVFGEDGGVHELATVSGNATDGYAIALTVPV